MSRDVFGVLLLLKELELGQCSDQSSFHSAVVTGVISCVGEICEADS